jgi:hypothetical protein
MYIKNNIYWLKKDLKNILCIVLWIIFVLLIRLDYIFLENIIFIHKISAILAFWTTIIGVIVGSITAVVALNTYRSNNSIKQFELIKNVYDVFVKDGWYEFYERIKKGDSINFEDKEKCNKDEKLLNEILTLFDTLCFFQTQGLLKDEKSWEYIASEILNFAFTNNVWKYIQRSEELYRLKGFHKDVVPFTGFRELLDNLPDKFNVKPPLEAQFNILSPEKKDYYYNQVKNIPNKFQRTAAIIIFTLDKEKKDSNC